YDIIILSILDNITFNIILEKISMIYYFIICVLKEKNL
ncbi:unnamed protein product, partial [marine sediment metagenome]